MLYRARGHICYVVAAPPGAYMPTAISRGVGRRAGGRRRWREPRADRPGAAVVAPLEGRIPPIGHAGPCCPPPYPPAEILGRTLGRYRRVGSWWLFSGAELGRILSVEPEEARCN